MELKLVIWCRDFKNLRVLFCKMLFIFLDMFCYVEKNLVNKSWWFCEFVYKVYKWRRNIVCKLICNCDDFIDKFFCGY